jgi:DNA modification methylase
MGHRLSRDGYRERRDALILSMNHELHNGDCLEVMASLPANSVDAVITDPPYGTTQCKWDSVIPFDPMWRELKRIAKPSASIILFGSQPFTSALIMSNPKAFRYEWVWQKGQKTGHLNAHRRPMSEHENIVVFSEGGSTYNPQPHGTYVPCNKGKRQPPRTPVYGTQTRVTDVAAVVQRLPSSVLAVNKGRHNFDHPTQKPIDLMRYLVRTYTNEGETVLDFTMGSGSTGVACALEDRRFIGIEKDPDYFAIAQRRIEEAKQSTPLFA